MKRLTSESPKDNTSVALNLFYIKDNETWVRGGGSAPDFPDVSLYDYVREIIKRHGLKIATNDNDAMSEHIYETLFDGIDTLEGVVSTLYTAAWAFSEIREKLKLYEDTGLQPEEITIEPYGCVFYFNRQCNLDGDFCPEGPGCPWETDADIAKHLLELARAEKDGRLVVLPCKVGDTLYIISHGIIDETKVRTFFLGHPSHNVEKRNMRMMRTTNWDISMDEIGKTIFLTREEAEAALEKREEADNEAD